MNLTALLVLTTLFISVTNSLPQTAYIKMVDVWLIFAQMVPWIYVLLHTLIDGLRPDEEEREINHHGKSITVGPMPNTDTEPSTYDDMTQVEEGVLLYILPFDPQTFLHPCISLYIL